MKATLCSVLVFFVVAGVLEAVPMAGGFHDREVTDPEVQEAATFAATEMNHELVDILAAQSQVLIYFIAFSVFNHVNKSA